MVCALSFVYFTTSLFFSISLANQSNSRELLALLVFSLGAEGTIRKFYSTYSEKKRNVV